MVLSVDNLPITPPEQQTAGPLMRQELERLRAEMRASIERTKAHLERIEVLLVALQLHERRSAHKDESANP